MSRVKMPSRAATDKFAIERSHRAAAAANENSRLMAQSALLINGGAATAVIAFLSKEKIEPVLLNYVPYSLGCYAGGVLFASLCAYFMTGSLDMWNEFWEFYARHGGKARRDLMEKRAEHSWRPAKVAYGLAIFCFLSGSVVLAAGLTQLPASPTSPVAGQQCGVLPACTLPAPRPRP